MLLVLLLALVGGSVVSRAASVVWVLGSLASGVDRMPLIRAGHGREWVSSKVVLHIFGRLCSVHILFFYASRLAIYNSNVYKSTLYMIIILRRLHRDIIWIFFNYMFQISKFLCFKISRSSPGGPRGESSSPRFRVTRKDIPQFPFFFHPFSFFFIFFLLILS